VTNALLSRSLADDVIAQYSDFLHLADDLIADGDIGRRRRSAQ